MSEALTCWPKGFLSCEEAEALLGCKHASDSEGYQTTEADMAEEKLEAAINAEPEKV